MSRAHLPRLARPVLPSRGRPGPGTVAWLALAVVAGVFLVAHGTAWADGAGSAAGSAAGAATDGTFDAYRSRGWLWAYLGAFGFGFLTSLTPCVYPMIPIVIGIFGGRGESVSRARAFLLATVYVIGMGLTFAVLGVVFAMIGARAGALLANPAVVIPIVLVYVALALSMFGLFELQLPSGLQQRLSGVSGQGMGGAFAMGVVGGFTAAPCTGPFLLGMLGFVTQTGNVAVGSTLLFTYALGMGVLFWVLAAFAVALPKSGRWMEWMKSIGGIALFAAAIHFLRPILPVIDRLVLGGTWFGVVALAVALAGIVLGAIHLSFHDALAVKLRKGAAVALTVVGITAGVSWLLHVDRRLPWIHGDEQAAFDQARREGKGVMIDFWASWCLPCKEYEHTFANAEVYAMITENFVPLQFDTSAQDDAADALLAKYHAGNPTVIFLDADHKELGRLGKKVGPAKFLTVLRPAADAIRAARQTAGAEPARPVTPVATSP
ncbi:MAG TPA: cytochrome c biogenesis protein CcdA [Kofleriaceae bacterium]|nr:cytochrome c biogenesis protein CcdA [Kofleriaceae bacterium]